MSIITIGLNPAIDRIVTARRESPFEPVSPTFALRPQKPHYLANKAESFHHKPPLISGFRGLQMLL